MPPADSLAPKARSIYVKLMINGAPSQPFSAEGIRLADVTSVDEDDMMPHHTKDIRGPVGNTGERR